jgi:hypothetical protein
MDKNARQKESNKAGYESKNIFSARRIQTKNLYIDTINILEKNWG